MIEEKIFFKSTDNLMLSGIWTSAHIPSDKCVILCHGITVDKDEDGIFADLSKKLSKEGYNVFRFDFRGHGESEGESMHMTIHGETRDVEAAVRLVRTRKMKNIAILAASFAGGPVSFYLTKKPVIIRSLIFWNALIDYECLVNPKTLWQMKYWGKEAFTRAVKYGYTKIGSRDFKVGVRLVEEIKMLAPWKALTTLDIPILFVHGDEDTYVPHADSVRYSKAVRQGKLVTIKGAEHGFHDNPAESAQADHATIEFLKNTL